MEPNTNSINPSKTHSRTWHLTHQAHNKNMINASGAWASTIIKNHWKWRAATPLLTPEWTVSSCSRLSLIRHARSSMMEGDIFWFLQSRKKLMGISLLLVAHMIIKNTYSNGKYGFRLASSLKFFHPFTIRLNVIINLIPEPSPLKTISNTLSLLL